MVAKLFVNHAEVEIGFRDLAFAFGDNHMTYASMKVRLRELEFIAQVRLTPLFSSTGLICADELT